MTNQPTPRRMKANPINGIMHCHWEEHDWMPSCDDEPKCLPVDAPVEPRIEGNLNVPTPFGADDTTPPPTSAVGTPVERWMTKKGREALEELCTTIPRLARQANLRNIIRVEAERLCALLDTETKRLSNMVLFAEHDAQEQRTRAEKLQERLDGYLAKHGAPPLTVKTHGYMLMEKERDQLKADLAAAREALRPFAEASDDYNPQRSEAEPIASFCKAGKPNKTLTVGDLRKARSAIKGDT